MKTLTYCSVFLRYSSWHMWIRSPILSCISGYFGDMHASPCPSGVFGLSFEGEPERPSLHLAPIRVPPLQYEQQPRRLRSVDARCTRVDIPARSGQTRAHVFRPGGDQASRLSHGRLLEEPFEDEVVVPNVFVHPNLCSQTHSFGMK